MINKENIEYKTKEYIVFEKLIESYPNFNLKLFLEKNKDLDLIVANSNTIYFEKNILEDFCQKQLDLKYFSLKGFPNDGEYIKCSKIDYNLEYIFKNAKEYNKDYKEFKHLNNKIRDSKSCIKTFELLSKDFFDKKIICFDVEAYEKDQNKLTEIGFSILENYELKNYHYIVEENLNCRNGKYVEDNRDNFLFGKSEIKPLNDILKILLDNLNYSDIVVGQGIKNDFKYVQKFTNDIRFNNYKIFDSEKLGKLLDPSGLSIKKTLIKLGIEFKYLHNAGNDAHFNIKMIAQILKTFDIELYKENVKLINVEIKEKKEHLKNKWENIKNDINCLELN